MYLWFDRAILAEHTIVQDVLKETKM